MLERWALHKILKRKKIISELLSFLSALFLFYPVWAPLAPFRFLYLLMSFFSSLFLSELYIFYICFMYISYNIYKGFPMCPPLCESLPSFGLTLTTTLWIVSLSPFCRWRDWESEINEHVVSCCKPGSMFDLKIHWINVVPILHFPGGMWMFTKTKICWEESCSRSQDKALRDFLANLH